MLLTDLEAFQAELAPRRATPPGVVVRLTLTLVRDLDRRVVATPQLRAAAPAPPRDDAADRGGRLRRRHGRVLRDATAWTSAVTGGGAGT